MRRLTSVVATCGAVVALALTAGPALAEPPAGVTPKHIDIVGVGADVTQYVVDAFTHDWAKQHPKATRKWYSFDAVGSDTITEKRGCGRRARPTGTGNGIQELEANLRPTHDTADYCVDFARASSGRDANAAPSSLLFIPFAIDAVTWTADKLTGTTNAPVNLTTTQLKAIFSCDASILDPNESGPVTWNEVGGTSSDAVIPVVPLSVSGTRKFFLQEIGVTTLGTCVQGQDNTVSQSEGTNAIFQDPTTAPDIVFPYSVADFLAQAQNGHNPGTQGKLVLRRVNGLPPTTGKAGHKTIAWSFPYLREIYNVVRNAAAHPNAKQLVPKYLRGLFGNGTAGSGWICANKAGIAETKSYGFLPTQRCGTIE